MAATKKKARQPWQGMTSHVFKRWSKNGADFHMLSHAHATHRHGPPVVIARHRGKPATKALPGRRILPRGVSVIFARTRH